MKNKHIMIMISIVFFVNIASAQIVPNIGTYQTLKCDFHMHTVFSDGEVWPTIRVDEAISEGLDVIAITDHLEYVPHKKYVSTDMNASYEIAKKRADRKGLVCIKGAEFTRWMPHGHFNALFITDANKLLIDDFLPAVEEAISQGAFIMWNHPGWRVHQPDGVVRWYDVHQTMVDRNWLHGIEFSNYHEYYSSVLTYTNTYKLAVFANSDIHKLSHTVFLQDHAHRPITLVFANEKSEDAVKEALFAARTLALSEDNILAGPEKLMAEFVMACLKAEKTLTGIQLSNISEIPFTFVDTDKKTYLLKGLGNVELPRNGRWEIANTFITQKDHLQLLLDI